MEVIVLVPVTDPLTVGVIDGATESEEVLEGLAPAVNEDVGVEDTDFDKD